MSNQPETGLYDAGVYQLEIADPVRGGLGGLANSPLLNLANRTGYLKAHVDALEALTPTLAPLASPTFTGTVTIPTPASGDSATKAASTAFVQNAAGGIATVNVAGNSNVTLTAAQYGARIIIFTGALTGSINVIFPTQGDEWIVVNNTTGAFLITCKTAAGAGAVVTQGKSSSIICDATNILWAHTDYLIKLSANATFYIATTGNDTTGDGTAGNPWATVQHAVNIVQMVYHLNGFSVTFMRAAGTYTDATVLNGRFMGSQGAGSVIFDGASMGTVTVNTSANTYGCANYAEATVQNQKVSSSNSGISATAFSNVLFNNVNFGACATHLNATFDSSITANGNYTVSGNATGHFQGSWHSTFICIGRTVTITGTLSISAWISLNNLGAVLSNTCTFSGTAPTGNKYGAFNNSVIDTNGAGTSYFPGTVAGSVATGSVYT